MIQSSDSEVNKWFAIWKKDNPEGEFLEFLGKLEVISSGNLNTEGVVKMRESFGIEGTVEVVEGWRGKR